MSSAYENQLIRKKRDPIPQDKFSIATKVLQASDPILKGEKNERSEKSKKRNEETINESLRQEIRQKDGRKDRKKVRQKERQKDREKAKGILGSSGICATIVINLGSSKGDT